MNVILVINEVEMIARIKINHSIPTQKAYEFSIRCICKRKECREKSFGVNFSHKEDAFAQHTNVSFKKKREKNCMFSLILEKRERRNQ